MATPNGRAPQRQPVSLSSDHFFAGLNYLKNAALTVNQTDMRAWELVSDVPHLSNTWAYVCAIMNLIIAGSGSMLASILGDANINKTQLGVGFMQLLTSIYLFGYVWSAYWAYLIVITSDGDHSEVLNLLGQGNRSDNPQQDQRGRRQNA